MRHGDRCEWHVSHTTVSFPVVVPAAEDETEANAFWPDGDNPL